MSLALGRGGGDRLPEPPADSSSPDIVAFSQFRARLEGLEPPARCLEATASAAGTVRDVQFFGRMTRYRSGRTGAVATGTSYRDVYRLLRFIESTPLTGSLLRDDQPPYGSEPSDAQKTQPVCTAWCVTWAITQRMDTTDRHQPGWLLQRSATVRRIDNYNEQGIGRIAQLAQGWPRREPWPQA